MLLVGLTAGLNLPWLGGSSTTAAERAIDPSHLTLPAERPQGASVDDHARIDATCVAGIIATQQDPCL